MMGELIVFYYGIKKILNLQEEVERLKGMQKVMQIGLDNFGQTEIALRVLFNDFTG